MGRRRTGTAWEKPKGSGAWLAAITLADGARETAKVPPRRSGAPVDQGVQLLDLRAARCGEEPVVDDQQLDLDEGVEAAFLVAGAFGDRDPVEQFPGRQVEDLAVLLAGLVRQGAGDVGLPGSGGSLQDDVLAFEQVGADSQPSDQFAVDAAAGHGLEVGQIGSGLRQACLPAEPVQLAVAPSLVFPVDGLFDQLGAGHGGRGGGVGEVLEVLGHPGQAHHLEPGEGFDVDHARLP